MRAIALIPLRSGSKGIPKKNIKLLGGVPLCYYVLRAVVQSKMFSEVVVSTDCPEIADVVAKFGADISILMRPGELATDLSTSEDVMSHALQHYGYDFDWISLVQATSPLLLPTDLTAAFELLSQGVYSSVVSAVRFKRFIWSEEGVPLNYCPNSRPRRQDFDGLLVENGAFYITRASMFRESRCRINGKVWIHEMSEDTLDELDEPRDWDRVELVIREWYGSNASIGLKK